MTNDQVRGQNLVIVKTLTYLMFAMFAMTTDSVGVIIPEVIRTLRLSLTAAGTFQYATMTGIAVAGLLLGSLADRFGRRRTIVAGLVLFGAACFLLSSGNTLWAFAVLLALSGLGVGVFKTGALALIGDISRSTAEHTSIMNAAEGFFGAGAIIGPALLTRLLAAGLSWKWLYVVAGVVCVFLVVLALIVRYPETPRRAASSGASGTGAALRNPYVLAFSGGAFLYVAVEAAIYVWMPTLLTRYTGSAAALAAYSLSIFFLLRAGGRFEGHQLRAEARSRRRGGRDFVLHVRVRGGGAPDDRRRRRCLRRHHVRLLARHRVRRPALRRSGRELVAESDAGRARRTRSDRVRGARCPHGRLRASCRIDAHRRGGSAP
jgi:fucose permease